MKGNPATIAHLEQLVAYFRDPTAAPHEHPPKPPSVEVAHELATSAIQLMAIMLDYKKTGVLHPDNPCPEAVLAVAGLAEKALDGNLRYSDCEDVARRFGC